MLLSDAWIRLFAEAGGITPFDERNINAASYDICLGNEWINWEDNIDIVSDSYVLMPGKCVLARSQEVFNLPYNILGFLTLKSSMARLFLNHMNSNLINPGFYGSLTLEFHNCSHKAIELSVDQKVSQVLFFETTTRDINHMPKVSRYQNQKKPTRS